ncbi:hypothetical protein A3B21_05225 [Candidatus Uhrbacteria bacterium RIFCSPLOWO2_01_FULL_47_24]|uniref:Uncharacterized protein n=1 Tax=Candidatus Uhrbacteria bacterium RIFCSPLOWO2_01_FULL_47_24 TaxID=1802401 RepID=A0A1F7UUZ7_9BACT|nr:MAG: hypothetical protein A2753_03260 [Candidatus Uhrbacteria bacterium RIFCSPHIGHO2_01_FULL_47_11]OGL75868.1 MAG: hypothetical protein A3F52_03485 [Candidatus Uhrbacteria bacterium RIFCSPHIGHO2_12_FULL_47_11]OGL82085.1 MAG: hypothetical protein A3B21_05225 [Candidatus Uhrbacteria bacterium RIFCSPLOWO2_01_FULL_47_24]OGL85480.1 MAG: hypothetical protein A3J03_05395 [Candidatus Uhrbacteria bacterium RIFCSPLOWO2_02_FULL_46_25]OGL92628.1 MAG: hypothetical protein A3H11_04150 [Candidatus Uhrbacte
MKYEACVVNKENDYVSPTRIPVSGTVDGEAIKNFKALRRAHGDSSLLTLKLMKIDDKGAESEIEVT